MFCHWLSSWDRASLFLLIWLLNLSSRGSHVQNFRSASPIPSKILLVNVTSPSSSSTRAEADLIWMSWSTPPSSARLGWSPVLSFVFDTVCAQTRHCATALSCPVLCRLYQWQGARGPLLSCCRPPRIHRHSSDRPTHPSYGLQMFGSQYLLLLLGK